MWTKEKKAAYAKQWYINNKKKKAIYAKQYQIDNADKITIKHKQWYKDNAKNIATQKKQWQKDNAEHVGIIKKAYIKTFGRKASLAKTNAKRRKLGFISLNEPFKGCEAHHISQNFVIYMPVELHQCLYHNIWTWQNMEEMNKLAINYL